MPGESLTNIESLPDELLFAILVHVPAQDIQNGARLVCRKWYHIIDSPDFIHEHLQHSPPGLVIQSLYVARHPTFVAMQQGRIKISEWNNKFNSFCMGSCNGLAVECNSRGGIYMVNPTTEERYALPPIFREPTTSCHNVMAYDAASMEYKVVLMYSYICDSVTRVPHCAILTIGTDTDWRCISTKHLSLTARQFFHYSPVIAGCFIHWTEYRSTHLLTLNVETEVFKSTPVPQGYEKRFKYFLSTGSCLTMVVPCSKLSWEVWELKQEQSGEWMKLFRIDVEAHKGRIQELEPNCSLIPVGWLNYGEVLVLHASHTSKACFFYDVGTQEIDSFQLNHNFSYSSFQFHRNSLVHLVV